MKKPLTYLIDLKINFQRMIFRLKRRWQLNRLEKEKREAVKVAERLRSVTGKQHKVLLVEGQYIVRSRRDLVNLNKMYPRLAKLNIVAIDKLTVYTTK
jgi:hypothetical protein